jgi:ketosteroid isomerase-like protein
MAAVANVDIVRSVTDAFNRRDVVGVLALMTADAQIDWTRSLGPLAGVYRGHDEISAFLHDTWEVFESFEVDVLEFIEADSGVVTPNRVRALGRGGIPLSGESTHLFRLEGGLVSLMRLYQQRDEALADAGPRA